MLPRGDERALQHELPVGAGESNGQYVEVSLACRATA